MDAVYIRKSAHPNHRLEFLFFHRLVHRMRPTPVFGSLTEISHTIILMYFTVMHIQFMKIHPDAKIPTKATKCAAGLDIATVESYCLAPGESHIFETGLAGRLSTGHCLVLFDRSGMGAKKNIHRLAGVIDEDYRGQILVCLVNLSLRWHWIHAGDNIVQGLVLPVPEVEIEEVTSLDETIRGDKGFGQLSGD